MIAFNVHHLFSITVLQSFARRPRGKASFLKGVVDDPTIVLRVDHESFGFQGGEGIFEKQTFVLFALVSEVTKIKGRFLINVGQFEVVDH